MAASTTITTIVDGDRQRIIHVQLLSDGAGAELTDSVIYDYSEDAALPSGSAAGSAKILQVWFENPTAAGQIFVEFDGATDALACGAGVGDSHHSDFRSFGGLKNNATTPTGDITVTTLGLAANDQASLVLSIAKG